MNNTQSSLRWWDGILSECWSDLIGKTIQSVELYQHAGFSYSDPCHVSGPDDEPDAVKITFSDGTEICVAGRDDSWPAAHNFNDPV